MIDRINRRQFLKTGSRALSAGALATAAVASVRTLRADANAGGKMKKAVKFGMVRTDQTILEKFQLLKELGFDGVEMDSPSSLDRDEVVGARDATGLTIHGVVDSVHWRQTLSDASPDVREQGLEGLMTALRDAHRYGATTVLLVPAVVNKEVSYAEAYERSQAEIRRALPLAEELGVKIALENVWNQFLLSPLEFAQYIDDFKSPWIGAYFDVGNVVTYGWPEHWIRTLNKRILKLDIKEFSRQRRNEEGLYKGFDVEIGEGDCDWPAVREALAEIGYSGWATAEVRGGGPERLREIAERMDRVLAL
jgi:hexulose-6-phosphate isomerase